MIDIDADQIAFGVVIQNHAFRDFLALHARSLREIDVKRIGIWKIVQFHGRNLRSRNALCIVILSESVTTRKKRPCNSPTLAQNDIDLALAARLESAIETTRMHMSFVKYGRFRITRFSKYGVKRYAGTRAVYQKAWGRKSTPKGYRREGCSLARGVKSLNRESVRHGGFVRRRIELRKL